MARNDTLKFWAWLIATCAAIALVGVVFAGGADAATSDDGEQCYTDPSGYIACDKPVREETFTKKDGACLVMGGVTGLGAAGLTASTGGTAAPLTAAAWSAGTSATSCYTGQWMMK